MTSTLMLEAALDYQRRGWPVFQVSTLNGAPLFASAHKPGSGCRGGCGQVGHGFHDATLDRDLITQWWTANPHAGIGVPTGIAFDVLDVDNPDHAEGVADLPELVVYGPQVRSARGGWHIYFKPSGLGRHIKFSKHCDWLGTDGYVIVPPSMKAGGQYEWIWHPDEIELQDVPVELAVMVMRSRLSIVPTPATTATAVDRLAHSRWNPSGLIGQVASAVEGERNSKLHWAAWRVGMDVREGKATRAEGDGACQQLDAVGKLVGLDDREVRATITSGYSAGLNGRHSARGAA